MAFEKHIAAPATASEILRRLGITEEDRAAANRLLDLTAAHHGALPRSSQAASGLAQRATRHALSADLIRTAPAGRGVKTAQAKKTRPVKPALKIAKTAAARSRARGAAAKVPASALAARHARKTPAKKV
jgi:hypothetical protein